MSKLVENLEILFGHPLTPEEAQALIKFQNFNEIDDSDPLLAVIVWAAKSHLILEEFPNRLQKEINYAIELNRSVLREQANVIAKDLILNIALGLEQSNKYRKFDMASHGVAFGAGILLTGILFILIYLLLHHQ